MGKRKRIEQRNLKRDSEDERRKSMAQVPSAMDLDIEDGQMEEDEEPMVGEEIDEVLSNLVKVECEYLLPFLCDIFDMIFERRKEIEIDDLLEYFVGLYEVPQFTTISDDEQEDNDRGNDDRDS